MRYLASELRGSGGVRSLIEHPGRRGDSMPIATSICLRSEGDTPTGVVRMGAPFETTVDFNAPHPIRPILGLTLKTVDGMPLFGVSNRWTNQGLETRRVASGSVTCKFERLPLMPGTYLLDLYFGDFGDQSRDLDIVRDAISFEVVPADLLGTGMLPRPTDGPVFWSATWTFA
jgi:hypothetical protein